MFTGVIVNAIAVVAGGGLGLILKNGFLKERYKELLMHGMGLAVIFVGISGAMKGLLDPKAEPLLFIISICLGAVIGEGINIEKQLEKLGQALEKKVGQGSGIAKGYVFASIYFCIGSMSIIGAFQSGLENNHTIFYVKSLLDGVSAIILSATVGVGVLFASLTIIVYQGVLTALSVFLEPVMTPDALREFSIVGNIIITAIGLDLAGIKKIRYANLFPAMFIPPIYYLILKMF